MSANSRAGGYDVVQPMGLRRLHEMPYIRDILLSGGTGITDK